MIVKLYKGKPNPYSSRLIIEIDEDSLSVAHQDYTRNGQWLNDPESGILLERPYIPAFLAAIKEVTGGK